MADFKKKIYKSEMVLYFVIGFFWAAGLVLAILGVCAYNIGKLANNPLYTFQKNLATWMGMEGKVVDLRLWGTIVMVVAMIAFLIVIYAFTAKANNEAAVARRKAERMKILMDADLHTPVVDVSKEETEAAPADKAE